MSDANRGNRPLSPHLQIYRLPLSAVSSILVRITAIGCLFAAVLIVAWLLAAATSPALFACVDGLMRSWVGSIVMLAALWALFYHMLGRLRHVVWDFGRGLDLKSSDRMAYGMFAGATILTILTALCVGGLK